MGLSLLDVLLPPVGIVDRAFDLGLGDKVDESVSGAGEELFGGGESRSDTAPWAAQQPYLKDQFSAARNLFFNGDQFTGLGAAHPSFSGVAGFNDLQRRAEGEATGYALGPMRSLIQQYQSAVSGGLNPFTNPAVANASAGLPQAQNALTNMVAGEPAAASTQYLGGALNAINPGAASGRLEDIAYGRATPAALSNAQQSMTNLAAGNVTPGSLASAQRGLGSIASGRANPAALSGAQRDLGALAAGRVTPSALAGAQSGLNALAAGRMNPAALTGAQQGLSALAAGRQNPAALMRAQQGLGSIAQGAVPGELGAAAGMFNQFARAPGLGDLWKNANPYGALNSQLSGKVNSEVWNPLMKQATTNAIQQFREGIAPSILQGAEATGNLNSSRTGVAMGKAAEGLGRELLQSQERLASTAAQDALGRQAQAIGQAGSLAGMEGQLGLQGRGQQMQAAGAMGDIGATRLGAMANANSALGSLGATQLSNMTQATNALGNLGMGQLGYRSQAVNALGNIGMGQLGNQTQAAGALGSLGMGQLNNQTQANSVLGSLGMGQLNNQTQAANALGSMGINQLNTMAGAASNLGTLGMGLAGQYADTALAQQGQRMAAASQLQQNYNNTLNPMLSYAANLTGMMPNAINMGLAPTDVLNQYGARNQGLTQAQLNEQMQRFNMRRNQAANDLGTYSQLINGNYGGTTTQQMPSNVLGSLAGLGMTAAAFAGM